MRQKSAPAKKARVAKKSDLLDGKFKPIAGTIFRKTGGTEILVVNFNQPDKFFRMDAWAGVLWQSLDGKSTLRSVCSKIEKKSKLTEEFVTKEALKLVQQLLKARLIQTK